jgi:hypothetical protein
MLEGVSDTNSPEAPASYLIHLTAATQVYCKKFQENAQFLRGRRDKP